MVMEMREHWWGDGIREHWWDDGDEGALMG